MTNPDTQPWEPEALTLNVGDRVRIRLSAECCYAPAIPRHEPTTQDCLALVYDILAATPDGHRYLVRFQQPYTSEKRLHWSGQFSRSELERVP